MAENCLVDKTIKRSINYGQEQYFDTASLLAFYSLYGLIDSAGANANPVVSKNTPVHVPPKSKLKSNPAATGNAGSDPSNPVNLLKETTDSKQTGQNTNFNNQNMSGFIAVSVLSVAELDQLSDSKGKVNIPVLTEVVTSQAYFLPVEQYSPTTNIVSSRLDFSDVMSFSAVQDSTQSNLIWITGAVEINVSEGGSLVFANALANAVTSLGVLSVVNLPAILPAGISYDTATSSFSFNPNDAAYNRLAEAEILKLIVAYKVSNGAIEVDDSVVFQIIGSNDAAIITGDVTGDLTEAGGLNNAILGTASASGQLFSADVDAGQSNLFQVITNALSDKAWGWYSIDANGHWSYRLDNSLAAIQALADGVVGSDSFTIKTVDGTEQPMTVFITGTDDLASLISATVLLDETDTVLTTSGALTINDPDSIETFVAQAAITGVYGVFNLTTAGDWTYKANSAFDNLVAGEQITDTFAVESSDGASTNFTVTITGSNDLATISGTSTAAMIETNSGLSASGSLQVADLDAGETVFVPQTDVAGSNGFGRFTINAVGDWTYSADAHNELTAGEVVTDSVTVASVDGSATQVITVTITGSNDAATISGTSTASILETNAVLTASGTLTVADRDAGETVFIPQTDVAGSNGFGRFSITAAGEWTYTAGAHNEFGVDVEYTDSITVASIDGTDTQMITVIITGTNDAALLSSAVVALDETDAALIASGTLNVSDVDSADSFVAQVSTVGLYGVFTLTNQGAWTYTTNSAYDNLIAGEQITDTFPVNSADGTPTRVNVTITGTNDVATISGTSTASVTETNAVLTASGTLAVDDLDAGETVFVPQTDVAGSNGFGCFTINAAGDWAYSADAHNELTAGQVVTDSVTVASVDGTASQVITVIIIGSNDVATISGTSTASITETNAVLTASGTLTVADLDTGETVFVSQTDVAGSNGFGHFSINAVGEWRYSAGAHNELIAGQVVTDSVTVASVDGTATQFITVTITGSNDAATISGTSTATLTESDAPLTASGVLTVADLDAGETVFASQTDVLGSNGFGRFSITAAGDWTYRAAAHNEFKAGVDYTDSIAVTSLDGTASQIITVTITGTNDAAVITGDVSGDVTEASDAYVIAHHLSVGFDKASGDLSAVDVDNLADGFSVKSQGQLGSLVIGSDGVWQYSVNKTNAIVRTLNVGGTTSDSVVVQSLDGTEKTIAITIHGTNEGPVAIVDTGSAGESGTGLGADSGVNATGNVLSNDTDIDTPHSNLVVTAVSNSNQSNGVLGALLAGQYGYLTLNGDGSFVYQIHNANPAVDQLARGQQLTDVFNYVISDGEFTDSNSLTITIQGGNDAPVLSLMMGADQGALIEDGATQVAQGQFSASDVDLDTVYNWSLIQAVGCYGELSIDQSGQWIYLLNNGYDNDATNPVQALAEGEHAKDYFTVRVEDQFGAYAEHKVTIDIRGVNDTALITGDISSQVVADSLSPQLTTFGTLFAYDADPSDVGFKPDTFLGQLGSLAIDENGDWTYSVDKDLPVIQLLGEGDSIDDVFTIQSIDGTQQSVTISIFGINDPADISGDVRGDVTEVSNPVATGHLGITDLDYGQASFIAQSAISGQYGVFELNEAGNWKYTLDSNNPDVVHLGVGETLNDLFTVTSFDGLATETINITINGVDDALILQGPSYNLVISSAANEQSNAIDTGSDLFQHFFLVDGEVVTDIEISWFYDQQQVTDYGILYLNSDTGGYKFLADSDVIQNLTTTKLALARIEISNNGEIHPSNIVITLTNAMTSTDVAGVVKLIDLNAGDLIDLSSLSALYDIEDVSFYHETQQDNNYLAVAHIPVLDVVNITDLQILIDSNSYDLSI